MDTATINVRLPRELKDASDAVLKREHTSVSAVVRDTLEFISREQRLPDFMENGVPNGQELRAQKRRDAFDALAGILGDEVIDLDEIKMERLARQIRVGVRV
jgi:antitoxin component of RelBE/YafQ-DinJ toxin-antitoxin module